MARFWIFTTEFGTRELGKYGWIFPRFYRHAAGAASGQLLSEVKCYCWITALKRDDLLGLYAATLEVALVAIALAIGALTLHLPLLEYGAAG